MRARCSLLVCVVALSMWSAACARSLPSMSADDVNCLGSEITISNDRSGNYTRTWNATCRGQVFDCSVHTPVLSLTEGAHCVPTRSHVPGQYPLVRARAAHRSDDDAEVKRGYDEAHQAHYVTGRFRLAHDLAVVISGAPKLSTDTIVVTLSGASRDPALRECHGIDVMINGQPITTTRNDAQRQDARATLESRFDASVFQPLAERMATFGVRACGTTFPFTPPQLEQLRTLLAVYSDLALRDD